MKVSFRNKIFLAIFLPSFVLLSALSVSVYSFVSKQMRIEYLERYRVLTAVISDTLQQLEESAEVLSKAGAQYLFLYYQKNGIPSEEMLQTIKKNIGVSQMCITNKEGYAIRDTETPAGDSRNFSFYQLCPDYEILVKGDKNEEITPIIPSYPISEAYKLVMLPAPGKNGIVEAGVQLNSIGNILRKSIKSDRNLVGLGLFTPNGKNLGYFEGKHFQSIINSLPFKETTEFFDENNLIIAKRVSTKQEFCCECIYKHLTDSNNRYFYWLVTKVSLDPLNSNLNILNKLLFIALFISVGAAFLLSNYLSKYLVKNINAMGKTIKKIMETKDLSLKVNIVNQDEISELAMHFNEMIASLSEFHKKTLDVEKANALQQLTKQVAHDLGSPVMALNMLLNKMTKEPEEIRLAAREAIIRIRDISTYIFDRYIKVEDNTQKGKFSVELVSPIIESILTEKRIEYQSNNNIKLNFNMQSDYYGLFVSVEAVELKRILSNIINNAVEAMEDKRGYVEVFIEKMDNYVDIIIKDNGKGIPEEILEKLKIEGITYDKKNGHGMGLRHAFNALSWWNGKLEITSILGEGSCFTIKLPAVQAPRWFVDKLIIKSEQWIVILDDDASVHCVWTDRFTGFNNIKHCYNIIEFYEAVNYLKQINCLDNAIFLCDYELFNEEKTGLDLIIQNDLMHQSVLVTSQYEDYFLRERCMAMDMKFLPKSLALYIPIEKEN